MIGQGYPPHGGYILNVLRQLFVIYTVLIPLCTDKPIKEIQYVKFWS